MPRDAVSHRRWLNDDAWFVEDCLFGGCGTAAQQACEQVVNQLDSGEPWDHARIADQLLTQL